MTSDMERSIEGGWRDMGPKPVRAVRVVWLDGRPDCVVYGVTAADEYRGFVRLRTEGKIVVAIDAAEVKKIEEVR